MNVLLDLDATMLGQKNYPYEARYYPPRKITEEYFCQSCNICQSCNTGIFIKTLYGNKILKIYTYKSLEEYLEKYLELSKENIQIAIHTKSLEEYLEKYLELSKENIQIILRKYADEDTIKFIEEIDFVDKPTITAILTWIDDKYKCYGKPSLDIMFDPETSELQFITIILPDCDWDSWKKIAKEVKEEMKRCGLIDLTSKVAVICLRGLQE